MRGQTEVKPIETEYNGYRFRSRLEARWAVFFDTAGIPYEYEPEGFVLTDGTYYLPDFYLPWYRCYVEIKPNVESEISKGMEMISKLAYEKEKCIGMLCAGLPNNNKFSSMLAFYYSRNVYGELYQDSDFVCFREGCWWTEDDGSEHGTTKHYISMIAAGAYNFFDKNGDEVSIFPGRTMTSYRSDFENAVKAAKQARFEHGECGAVKKTEKIWTPMGQIMSIISKADKETLVKLLPSVQRLQVRINSRENSAFGKIDALDWLLDHGYEPEGRLEHEQEIRQFMENGTPC